MSIIIWFADAELHLTRENILVQEEQLATDQFRIFGYLAQDLLPPIQSIMKSCLRGGLLRLLRLHTSLETAKA